MRSSPLPITTPKRLISALKRLGFYDVRQTGSHRQLKRGNLLVTVPMQPGDVSTRILRSILRQAHLSVEDLKEAL
ncbi:MAG: type II toxin-antitoxin system HicA family toxin [Acidobacteriia bacterium]|nr:type II toxin-antitoxin system HicA family toxin [Terriglobia bacterium]